MIYRPPDPSESDIGKMLFEAWCLQWPELRRHMIHIPNGAFLGGDKRRRAIQVARLKAEGLQPGASDYLIAVPTQNYHGLFLEIKAKGKKPSDAQDSFQTDMSRAGYNTRWAAGFDNCWAIIKNYMILAGRIAK